MRQWCDYHLLIDSMPDWFKTFAKLSPEKQLASMQLWKGVHFAEYYLFMIRVVEIFGDRKLEDLRNLVNRGKWSKEDETALDTFTTIATVIISNLASYKAEEMQYFEYKGKLWKMPEVSRTMLAGFEQIEYGPSLTVGQVIENLQRSHIYGAKGEDGQALVEDARYQTDLATVATMARKVLKRGKRGGEDVLEELPLGISAYTDFVNKRIKYFEKLPARVGLNANFFLLNSGARFVQTLTRRLPLRRRRSVTKRTLKGIKRRKESR